MTRFKMAAVSARKFTNSLLFLNQYMNCTGYVLLLGGALQQIISQLAVSQWNIQLCIFIVSVLIIPIALVKDLNRLALFTGTVLFVFEAIPMVLPIRNKMRDRSAMAGYDGGVVMAMTIVVCLCAASGFYGLLAYGDTFQVSLLDMLDLRNGWDLTAFILWDIVIYVEFSIVFYVPFTLTYPTISHLATKTGSISLVRWSEQIYRVTLVLIMFAIASAIPCLNEVISLMGSFCGAFVALLIPATLQLLLGRAIILPTLTLMLGLFGFFAGVYSSLDAIVTKLGNGQCLI